MNRPNEAPLPEPLGYFLTWTTYGSWLPGDARGWTRRVEGFQLPAPQLRETAAKRLVEPQVVLDATQRRSVEETIRDHSLFRQWELFAVSCRTNHVHVVVAAGYHPAEAMRQFKAWCTRKLNAGSASPQNRNWWSEGGSKRYLNDERSLEAAILYVRDAQDKPRE